MKLTTEVKTKIDNMSVEELLSGVRFSPIGDLMFQGESGDYWLQRLAELRKSNNTQYAEASRTIGW